MIMQACAVYDKKVNAYMLPQFFRTRGEAMRAFMDAVNSEQAPWKRHAEDYLFCLLGTYDDSSGVTVNKDVPEILMSAMDCVVLDNNNLSSSAALGSA
ncbi:VP5 [Gokushovirus WZ-2015a]|nr:VP5 [Gokushovirus WZ-2015a]